VNDLKRWKSDDFNQWFLCRHSVNWRICKRFPDFETHKLRQWIQKCFFLIKGEKDKAYLSFVLF